MRYIKNIQFGIVAVFLAALTFSPLVLADAKSECAAKFPASPTSPINQAASACEAGYANENNCGPYVGSQLAAACAQGVTLGKAQQNPNPNPNEQENTGTQNNEGTEATKGECGGTKTGIVSCDEESGIGAIGGLIKLAVTILTVLIGIVSVGGIAYAAILYASARDNQSQVQSAIAIIRNIIIGLVMYGFTIAIINWLVPGGVIG